MNILFVNHGGFDCVNSAIHIFHLANQLVDEGLDCAVAVPEAVEKVELLGEPRFRSVTYEAAAAGKFGFVDRAGPSLIHAWTPREHVRRLVQRISRDCRCPYVVHLEDNEDEIAANQAGLPFESLRTLPAAQLNRLIPEGFSHPIYSRQFLANAAGVTAIIDRLLEFKPDDTPGEVLWPGFDPIFADLPARNEELRYGLSIAEDEFVLVYPGNTHASNREEMRSLYTSVGLLNSRGHKVRLVRFGTDYCDPMDGNREFVLPYCLELGFRPRQALPGPMAMADALVQPGRPSRFNDYRLPSKLPDFLISGRPVVLPRTNLGRFLRDGEECLLLDEGDAIEIAGKLERLIRDPDLRQRIGMGGKEFACRELNWEPIAAKIRCFYERVLTSLPRGPVAHYSEPRDSEQSPRGLLRMPCWPPMDAGTLQAAASRYAGCFPVPTLSYATVQDFCDSYDHLQALATETHDLKDCQRPWTLKAILGTVPRAGRLLEIGAGEPIVAELLSCLGYDVSVVDPYDGSGNGPVEYERFRRQYPGIHFLRQSFTEDLVAFDPGTFDCIYSISVLEHIPEPELAGVFKGIARLLKPDGRSIHAVDYVTRGAGADWDETHTARLLALSGFSRDEFEALRERLTSDLETYYLSAEGHNAWRGSRPYSEFPMRAVVGVQIHVPRRSDSSRQADKTDIPIGTNLESGTKMAGGPIPFPPAQLMNNVGSVRLEDFLAVGEAWAHLILQHITRATAILDIGCGCGRTARFLAFHSLVERYVGFDVMADNIAWARTHIEPRTGGRFQFVHCDVYNGVYNPGGAAAANEYLFPVKTNSIDLAYAASLFTHLLEADAQHYLKETSRCLRPNGILIASIHDQAAEGENVSGSESRIDVQWNYFVEMAATAGLVLSQDLEEIIGQHVLIFRKGA